MTPKVSFERFVLGSGLDERVKTKLFYKRLKDRERFWRWFESEFDGELKIGYDELAKKFGVSRTAVRRWLLVLGGRSAHSNNVDAFKAWFQKNRDNVEAPCLGVLAKQFNLSMNGLKDLIKRLGGWTFDAMERELVLRRRRANKLKETGRKNRLERARRQPAAESYETFVFGEGKYIKNVSEKHFKARQETRMAFWRWFHYNYQRGEKVNFTKLGAQFGISKSSARTWFEKISGVRTRKDRNAYDDFRKWFKENRNRDDVPTSDELAKKFNVGATTIRRWIKRNGGYKTNNWRGRRFQVAVQACKEALADAPPKISVKAFLIESGLDLSSRQLGLKALEELKRRGDPNVNKIAPFAYYKHSTQSIAAFAERYYSEHGRRPSIGEIASWLEIAEDRTRARVNRFIKSGSLDEKLIDMERTGCVGKIRGQEEEAFWREVTSGDKTRPRAWLESIEFHRGLGFEFTGEYWNRYYELWQEKTKGMR